MDAPENPNSPPERVIEISPRKWPILRLIIACVFGGVIVFFSLRAGYDAAKYSASSSFSPQFLTQAGLKQIIVSIEEYRQDHGALPRTLDQIPDIYKVDGWKRPFLYTIQGKDYSVTSYGQDGKPGGTGWDMDITFTSQSGNFHFVHSLPSFRQYFTAPVTRDGIWTAWITGILAAILCFITLKPQPLTRWSIAALIVRTGAIFVAAVVVGVTITELHVPSGH